MEDQFIEIEGISIRFKRYISEASQPYIVFLHGYSFTADTWEEIGTLDFLMVNGVNFLAVDMPGFGKSGGKRIRDGFIAARFLNKVLTELDVKRPVLVGPSMGGRYALSYAILYPEEVSGLILVAPAGLNEEGIRDKLGSIKIPVLIFWGTKDRVFPLELGYRLKEEIPNSRLVICEDAPHPCYLKSTSLFNEELLKFVRSIIKQ